MPHKDSRRGAVDMGMPLMILAFLVIGGFMYWLKMQADAEEQARIIAEQERIRQEEVQDSLDALAELSIDPNALSMDATPFEAQEVRVPDMPVASMLGEQGFWMEMPNGNPFLVEVTGTTTVEGLMDGVVAEELQVQPGEYVTVTGIVRPMSTEILDLWEGAGTITGNDRIVAEFASHYIEANIVQIGDPPSDAGMTGGEGDETGGEGDTGGA